MKLSRAGLCGILLWLGACASHEYTSNPGHRFMSERRFPEAAEAFSAKAKLPGKNQLLFLMDSGVAYFDAKDYDKAIEAFLKAEDLAEIKDYTSLSEEAGSLLTNDNLKLYRGEDFEKVLINVYLALSYSALGKLEDAQVEARKINQILYRMIHEGKRNYQESPFARYLSGLIWEAGGDWNNAYVDDRYVQKLNPDFPGIGADLIFLANRLGFRDEEREWRSRYPSVPLRPRLPDRTELIVFFERGQGPIKIPRDGQASSLPRFVPRYSSEAGASLTVDGVDRGRLQTGLDVENTSIQFLEERMGKLIARKLLSATMKGAVAAGVGAKSKDGDLGLFVFQLLMMADQADLRSWRSLPADIDFLRVPVPPGKHNVKLSVLDYGGNVHREVDLGEVSVSRNEKKFLTVR